MSDPEQQPPSPAPIPDARAGRCAIVGRPNVGKSTLLNGILGQKLVIVTPRPGTTRTSVLGVFASTEPPTQIAFVDTPGFSRPKTALGKLLAQEAESGFADADVLLFVTDADGRSAGVRSDDEPVLAKIRDTKRPTLLIVNKVDRIKDKTKLLPLLTAYNERFPFAATVPTSAARGTNLDRVIAEIRTHLPAGLLYDPDFLTDRPERFFAAELIREAVMNHTREEVPHGSAVMLDEYTDEGKLVRILATIVVEKPSHKKIVIGARGQLIKQIGTEARLEIERFLGRKVYLELWVKVVPEWTQHPEKARRLIDEASS